MSMNEGSQVLVHLQIGTPEQQQLKLKDFLDKMSLAIYGDNTPDNPPSPQVAEIIESRDTLRAKAMVTAVKDDPELEESKKLEKELKELKKRLETGFNPTRDYFHRIHGKVLEIQKEIAIPIDEAIKHLSGVNTRYSTEKWRLQQVENTRVALEAAKQKKKLLAEAEKIKTPEIKEQKKFIAETFIPAVKEIPQTKWKKEIQIIDRAAFLRRLLMIPGMDKYFSVSRTGMNRLADDNFDLEKTTYIEDPPQWRQGILGNTAVIVAEKM